MAGKFLISNFAGKQMFLMGLPSTLAGQCFCRIVTEGGVWLYREAKNQNFQTAKSTMITTATKTVLRTYVTFMFDMTKLILQ